MPRSLTSRLKRPSATSRRFAAFTCDAVEPLTLDPVRPNAGFDAAYRRKLMVLINAMSADVTKQVLAQYADQSPEIAEEGLAQDESPAMALRKLMASLTAKWMGRFDEAAKGLADYFAKGNMQRSDRALQAILRKAGFSVKLKLTAAVNDVLQATIGENVGLIKSIPVQYLLDVQGLVMRSVTAGRDLKSLAEGLTQKYGITKRRAAFIAKDQNNKATASIQRARQMSLGITEGVWLHSRGGKEPRREHVAFSGKRFSLKEGHDFGDGFGPVVPGQAINCRCVWKPVIEGS